MSRNTVLIAGIIILTVALIGIYYFLDPADMLWFPKCLFKQLTGWDCPACGNQRALHALLHGEFSEAFNFNPFVVISLPYVLLFAYTTFSRSKYSLLLKPYIQHRITVNIYLIAIIAWWILRNV